MATSLNVKYGLKRVINASGRMSILGVSSPSDSIMEAMRIGGKHYFEMFDLINKSGKVVAETLRSEDAIIVNSASSGIVLSIAGLITQGNRRRSQKIHQEKISKREVILFKGHNVQYGAPIETMISLGGGEAVEVGFANEGYSSHIAEAITENTAAILYVQSHHAVHKNMISCKEAWEVAKASNIPFIVDAAAEEDIYKYQGISDLAIYSGSKALEGPTSGIVAGKQKYITWIKTQLDFIGRSMKIGKESIFGTMQALEEYGENREEQHRYEVDILKELLSLNEYKDLDVSIVEDDSGRNISRARIHINENISDKYVGDLRDYLLRGDIAIYTRDYGLRQGFLDIDPRSLTADDVQVILNKIKIYLEG